ncbi:MAG: hypothetical protein GXZ08_02495 [Tissierellia bacterium]|nr:hypothetical protein [Tissierellia bacterium]
MKYTNNLNLRLPENDDYVLVEDLNSNAEIIDREIQDLKEDMGDVKALKEKVNTIDLNYVSTDKYEAGMKLKANKVDLHDVASTGSYQDLKNKPDILGIVRDEIYKNMADDALWKMANDIYMVLNKKFNLNLSSAIQNIDNLLASGTALDMVFNNANAWYSFTNTSYSYGKIGSNNAGMTKYLGKLLFNDTSKTATEVITSRKYKDELLNESDIFNMTIDSINWLQNIDSIAGTTFNTTSSNGIDVKGIYLTSAYEKGITLTFRNGEKLSAHTGEPLLKTYEVQNRYRSILTKIWVSGTSVRYFNIS